MHDLDVTEEMKATVKVIQLPTSTRAGQVRSPRRPKPARLGGTWAWRALCGAHPVLGSVLGTVTCRLTRPFGNPARQESLLSLLAKESTEGRHLPRGLIPGPPAAAESGAPALVSAWAGLAPCESSFRGFKN